MPFPHYNQSTAAMNKWEPIYTNTFEVQITPPTSAPGDYPLIVENVRKVDGLEIDKNPGVVEQLFKGSKRFYAGSMPDTTGVDLTIEFEVNLNDSNQMYVYTALKAWNDLVFKSVDGTRTLASTYMGGPISVQVHNKEGFVFKNMVFYNVFPSAPLTPISLDYSSGTNLYVITASFKANYWEDINT